MFAMVNFHANCSTRVISFILHMHLEGWVLLPYFTYEETEGSVLTANKGSEPKSMSDSWACLQVQHNVQLLCAPSSPSPLGP